MSAEAVATDVPWSVRMRAIVKRFGDITALDGVDLEVRPGEVHALLGENGAGKTTLMRILYGLSSPDDGEIFLGDERLSLVSSRDAIESGIGMVTQHFSLVGRMTVAENVAPGMRGGFVIDLASVAQDVVEASARFGMAVDPLAPVELLAVGQRQRVEILKALMRECRVLILDEPTAVLVPQEIEALMRTLRRLRDEGLAIVFISHKLQEVLGISDRVTVLRHGTVTGERATHETDERELASLMIGRLVLYSAAPGRRGEGEVALRVEELAALGGQGLPALQEVSFAVRERSSASRGSRGTGRRSSGEIMAGMWPTMGGRILVDGRDLAGADPAEFIDAGVGRILEDRHGSVVAGLSVAQNMALEHLGNFARGMVLDGGRLRSYAEELIRRFDIRARPDDPIESLSGGNMQKVLLARVLARDPKVLVVAQPTRGLDVGATEYVRSQLRARRDAGAAIVLISEDLDEILELADRILVIYEGRIVGEMDRAGVDVERLGLLMAGMGESG